MPSNPPQPLSANDASSSSTSDPFEEMPEAEFPDTPPAVGVAQLPEGNPAILGSLGHWEHILNEAMMLLHNGEVSVSFVSGPGGTIHAVATGAANPTSTSGATDTVSMPLLELIDLPGIDPAMQPRFDAVAFVNSLEEVDISTIPAEDMRCPHCWLPFGTTEEDDPSFVPELNDDAAVASHMPALHQQSISERKPNNDPVKTPCGHIFGKTCLIDSLEKTSTSCPICRQDLRPRS